MEGSGHVKISIIIPVYNREKYIGECLDSVIRQTLVEKEIVCIDDGSTDNTVKILESYAEIVSSIVILKQTHSGVSAARNYGIEKAKGEYIAFMDSDDCYPNDNVLEYMYNKAKEYGALIVGGGVAAMELENPTAEYIYGNPYSFYRKEEMVSFLDDATIGGFWRNIYKKEFLIENDIKFPNVSVLEDTFFLFLAKLKAKRYLKVPKLVYVYHIGYRHKPITDGETLEAADMISQMLKLAKKNHASKIQKQIYAYSEVIPLYRLAALKKGKYLAILKELWEHSLFDKMETYKMLLSIEEMEDVIQNGEKYETEFIDRIKGYSNCVIYGKSGLTINLINFLRGRFNISITSICVSKGYLSQKNVGDIPMVELDDLVKRINLEDTIFLVAARGISHEGIRQNLEKFGCKHYHMVDFRKLQLFPHALDLEFVWG